MSRFASPATSELIESANSFSGAILVLGALVSLFIAVDLTRAHEDSAHDHERTRAVALAKATALAEDPTQVDVERATCQMTIQLLDAGTGQPLGGLVRITNLETGKAIKLTDEIHRELNWYALADQTTVNVPQTKLKIEAFHGIETKLQVHEEDVTGILRVTVKLALRRMYDPRSRGLVSGNTHLHLMKLTYAEAHRYLRLVPQADGLDLVFLSHLRRLPDEKDYISNRIVETSLAGGGGELRRLSQHGTLFANGEEHRHNFSAYGEGYGHVMLLDLLQLIRPVSIGPGIMTGEGTDGIPLQRGIRTARNDGATVIWCHNTYGFEDTPNLMAGLLHALNIFDGSVDTTYEESFYKYLNLGLHLPFSTGTDWFIYDFSRVYVPLEGELSAKDWLSQLQSGKSYITNGTFLEFTVSGYTAGDTIGLAAASELKVQGVAVGRNDFSGIELVSNGEVIHTTQTESANGYFRAQMEFTLKADQPGWLALRIPMDAGKNEFGKGLFAHTSPIYIEMAGKRIFQSEVAKQLVTDIQANMEVISEKGIFANEDEREAVLKVHRQGMEALHARISGEDG
jgi:hypothetical protein